MVRICEKNVEKQLNFLKNYEEPWKTLNNGEELWTWNRKIMKNCEKRWVMLEVKLSQNLWPLWVWFQCGLIILLTSPTCHTYTRGTISQGIPQYSYQQMAEAGKPSNTGTPSRPAWSRATDPQLATYTLELERNSKVTQYQSPWDVQSLRHPPTGHQHSHDGVLTPHHHHLRKKICCRTRPLYVVGNGEVMRGKNKLPCDQYTLDPKFMLQIIKVL